MKKYIPDFVMAGGAALVLAGIIKSIGLPFYLEAGGAIVFAVGFLWDKIVATAAAEAKKL